jgi:hypothetical protein
MARLERPRWSSRPSASEAVVETIHADARRMQKA